MSVPPVEPVHPPVAETSGNATCVTVDSPSLAVALSVNEPPAAGRNHSVPDAESQYCAEGFVPAVGAAFATVGALVSILAMPDVAEYAETLPTLSPSL